MLEISAIPAFKDNYIWMLHAAAQHVVVVDPGDAAPVIERLRADNLHLAAILITHHHADHQGGVSDLCSHWPDAAVYGPANESITGCSQPLSGGELLQIAGLGVAVRAVPGHTRGHLAYCIEDAVFCGDTLFGAGCGRLFEGTPAQMLAALDGFKAMPPDTRFYCAHEYTEMNLRFALAVEPENPQVLARVARVKEVRQAGKSTVPLLLAEERATNPFLRCTEPIVIEAAMAQGAVDTSELAVFTALRQWRNNF